MKDLYNVFLKQYGIFLFVIFLWIIHLFNFYFKLNFYELGIFPRTLDGLFGILFAPLVHSTKDHHHLISNSLPFLILGWSLFYFYKPIAWRVLFFSWMLTGLIVWFIARPSFHIGLSGVIYSLLFFIFFSGVIRTDTRLLTIAMLVVFIYGSMVWGLFPYDWTISHESHISGAITGFILSVFYKKQNASFKKNKTQWEIEEELGIENDFLEGIWNEEIKD